MVEDKRSPDPIDFTQHLMQRDFRRSIKSLSVCLTGVEVTDWDIDQMLVLEQELINGLRVVPTPEQDQAVDWDMWRGMALAMGRFPRMNPDTIQVVSTDEIYARPEVIERFEELQARIEGGELDVIQELFQFRRQLFSEQYGLEEV